MEKAVGKVIKAFANLLYVKFEGGIKQGEICLIKVKDLSLFAEVIEIAGDVAKVQVFEDTSDIKFDTEVEFTDHLLEAELGPGLLTSIVDGLQNPLEKVAQTSGFFLNRGINLPAIDREKRWEFNPICKKGDVLRRGDVLGSVQEGKFTHFIMVPFTLMREYKILSIENKGSFLVEDVIATAEDNNKNIVEFKMLQKWPVKNPLLEGDKVKATDLMDTGLRIIDSQLPVLKGGTFCTPGPFGAGKTVLQHHLAKFSSVDIVVVTACGERAGEVVEILKEFPKLIDERTGLPLLDRTVIICNTSSMPVAAREASVYLGVSIAEYYRQMGLDVLLLADSTSRWAQAMREMSGRLEEIPGEEAFPAYLSSKVASFYERAGKIRLKNGKSGSLTIGGAVSPAGGNFEEPVTQSTLAVVGAFLGLSRDRSDARRYPAIDPLISWTKYLESVAAVMEKKIKNWGEMVLKANFYLREGDEVSKRMEVVGEEGVLLDDFIIFLKSEMYDICYLQQNAFDKEDKYCPIERQIDLFKLIFEVFDAKLKFDSHDDARDYFLVLQNSIKNLNYMPFQSSDYKQSILQIKTKIKEKVLDESLR